MVLNGREMQIVGVMPAGFAYPDETVDVWRPTEWEEGFRTSVAFRRAHGVRAVARLKPGATLEHANVQLQAVVSRLKVDFPATNRVMGATMISLHDYLVGLVCLAYWPVFTFVAGYEVNAVLRPDAELFAGDLRYFIELYTSSMNYEEIESRLHSGRFRPRGPTSSRSAW